MKNTYYVNPPIGLSKDGFVNMEKHVLLANKFCRGEYEVDVDCVIWREAFEYLRDNLDRVNFDKSEIHTLWTENGGHLRRKIKNDNLLLAVLTASLPGYNGRDITLYRGECRFLYDVNKIGFCWSSDVDVATCFARGLNAVESGGVLLEAYAPSSAILAGPNYHSTMQMREFEYTCNPKLLQEIKAINFFDIPKNS